MYNLVKQLWSHISIKRKINLFLLFILMVIAAICEVISIGAIIPFLSAFLIQK